MNARLRIEFLDGIDIFDAGKSALSLAEQLNVGIIFSFNEVECTMWPGDSPKILKKQYLVAVGKSKHELKMAFGH
jgi:hypothetical protein